MSEDLTVDDVSMETIRRHLREAGQYVLTFAVLVALDEALHYVHAVYQFEGWVRGGVLLSSIILTLAAILNGVALLSKLDDAGSVAWRMERLRTYLAAGLILTSTFLCGFAYAHYTGASEPFEDRVDFAEEERQSALEAAAGADDPDVVEEHMEAASAAQSEADRYEMYNRFWRFGPAMLALFSGGVTFLMGLRGLFTNPQPEVTHADV
jgi:hypothetical protein